jgi:hypothetical protein
LKRSPEEEKLHQKLKSSKFSAQGFMGSDRRPVDEIIAADRRVLNHKGVSIEMLVEALARAYQKAQRALGAEVTIRPGVVAVFHESMGRVPSPFKGDGVFAKGEAVVTELASGQHIILTQLGIALIERHHFFQGIGSRYRIDPETALHILGLEGSPTPAF